MASSVIVNDGTKTGIKFISDTGDYTVPVNSVVQGINQVIAMQNGLQVRREITIECRSANSKDSLMKALKDSNGVAVEGAQYVVVSVTPVSTFGTSDANAIQTWTFRVELIRYDNQSS